MIKFLTALLTRILCTSLDSISEQYEVDDREKMRNGLEPQKRTRSSLEHHKNVNVQKKRLIFFYFWFLSYAWMSSKTLLMTGKLNKDPKPIWSHPAFVV